MVPTGITVDGKPLEQVIKDIEIEEKVKEIRRERKDTIKKQKRCRYPTYRGMKYPDHKEKNGKPYHLPACQLEKEKGKMEQKITLAEHVFNFLKMNRGTSFTLSEIVDKIREKKGNVSVILSDMAKARIISAFPQEGKDRSYSWPESSEGIIDVNIPLREYRKSRKKELKETTPLEPPIKKTIEEVVSKALGIKVEVSGSIQIKFVFEQKNQD
jgi:hypothetical protein